MIITANLLLSVLEVLEQEGERGRISWNGCLVQACQRDESQGTLCWCILQDKTFS